MGEKQGRYKKPRIEFFLANFIAGQIAGEVNLTKLFSEYKSFNKSKKYSNVETELKEIGRFGAIYKELVARAGDSPLASFSRRLFPWDVTTVFPLVMRLAAEDMPGGELGLSLDTLLSYIVRRGVCGLTTKNYNKFFLSAIAHLEGQGWSAANLIDFLLVQKSETGRFPRNDEFEQKWLDSPVYTDIQPTRARALLEEIELVKRTRFHETTTLAKDLTVEHVMPRQWMKTWPLEGVDPTVEQIAQATFSTAEDDTPVGRIVRRNRMKNTIGNLTLLTQPLNSSVSNGPYAGKREALEKHSLLVLNREITKNETWDEGAILARSKALLPLALGIWRLPETALKQRATA